MSHILIPAGFPLSNLAAGPTPVFIGIFAPSLAPTSTPIAVPNAIIFPASPLPAATLPHQALSQYYEGLRHNSPSDSRSPARTASLSPTSRRCRKPYSLFTSALGRVYWSSGPGCTPSFIADGPGALMRCLLGSLALASILVSHLVRASVLDLGHALVCVPTLVCVSWVLFVVRRVSFKTTATHTQVSIWAQSIFH